MESKVTAASQDERLIPAWLAHREGNHEGAVAQFQQILNENDKNLDALYGLGQALRDTGDKEGAREVWQKATDLIKSELADVVDVSGDSRNERMFMMSNMLKQRIEELESD